MNDYLVNKEDLDAVANAINKLDRNYEPITFPDGFISKLESISQYVKNLSLTVNTIGCKISEYTPTVMQLSTVFLTAKTLDGYFFRRNESLNVGVTGAEFSITIDDEKGIAYITIFNITGNVTVNVKAYRKFSFNHGLYAGIYFNLEKTSSVDLRSEIYEGENSPQIHYMCDPGVVITDITATNGRVIWDSNMFYVTDIVGNVDVTIHSNVHIGDYKPGNFILHPAGVSNIQPDLHYTSYMHESEMETGKTVEDYDPDYYMDGWLFWLKKQTGLYCVGDSIEYNILVNKDQYGRYYYPVQTYEVIDTITEHGHILYLQADTTVSGCDYVYEITYETKYWDGPPVGSDTSLGEGPGQYYYREEEYEYEDPETGETISGTTIEYIGKVGFVNPNQFGLKASKTSLKLYNFNNINERFYINLSKFLH